jgi:FkbH-like protein
MGAARTVKCVVWDLDGTLWDGVLLEDRDVTPRPEIVAAITTLSDRGILHSIASRNDAEAALAKLSEHGLDEHFLYPQIGWGAKSHSIPEIARRLNFGIDALSFVDDQPFELDEVGHRHPSVLCLSADEICDAVRSRPEFQPRFITDESRIRRLLYRSEERRVGDEQEFTGTSEEFLATLHMRLTIAPALEADLQRAEELTVRTNQLNSTGRTYSYEQLAALREDPNHLLLVASLEDRYGPYGRIGLALVQTGAGPWTLRLLLMSCRVMSRGVGSVLLHHIMRLARAADASLHAELVDTGRNRLMYVTYRFAGFREVSRDGDVSVLQADLSAIPEPPDYLALEVI